jgi:hypothetical protein
MKKQILSAIIIALTFTMVGCKKECNFPVAPYGSPDDVSEYHSNGYNSITYTYYCKNFKYISITYTQTDGCNFKKSEYSSTGICKR